MNPKDLTPIENPDAALTEEEIKAIENMPPHAAQVLALKVIKQAGETLRTQGKTHNAIARGLGYENAEHEALAFAASEHFDDLVCGVTKGQKGRPSAEYALSLVRQAYGDHVDLIECERPKEIPRREKKKPSEKRYVKVSDYSVGPIIAEYSRIIRAERLPSEAPSTVFVLEGLNICETLSS